MSEPDDDQHPANSLDQGDSPSAPVSREVDHGADDPAPAAAATDTSDPSENNDPRGNAGTRPQLAQAVNKAVSGQLVVHYPARDVTFAVDGHAAMRCMTVFVHGREMGWAHPVDPEASLAINDRIALDYGQALAMTWLVDLPDRQTAPQAAPGTVAAI